MKIVTKQVAKDCREKAEEWRKTGSGEMFNDCSSAAKTAYMEALANQQGYTFWERYADE